MTNETTWGIEQHTLAKHEILRRYLGAWFPILTSTGHNRRVIYLDGFAGPGRYVDGESGSPLIALDTLVNHSHFSRMSRTEFVFAFVEQDSPRFHSLQSELDLFWDDHGGKPTNVDVRLFNEPFEDVAEHIISSTRGRLAPTFAFIDPFGWSGVPMNTVRELLKARKCEILFNFMYESVNRFVADTRPGIHRSFSELFGSEEDAHRRAATLRGDNRKTFLHDLYLKQLRTVCRFDFVRSFEMIDQRRNRTAYFLMYGTRHHRGLQVMKDAMWAVDPVSGARFSGSAGAQQMLFSPEPNLEPLRTALINRFASRTVTVERIERFIIEDTDYKTTHYKSVLRDLENAGDVECMTKRKRRNTYPPGTELRFTA